MIIKLYSVKDKLVGFGGPIAIQDDKIAKRWFESFCKQKRDQEMVEPKYYELYCVGSFDSEKGNVIGTAVQEVELIAEGEAFNE